MYSYKVIPRVVRFKRSAFPNSYSKFYHSEAKGRSTASPQYRETVSCLTFLTLKEFKLKRSLGKGEGERMRGKGEGRRGRIMLSCWGLVWL